MRAARAFAWLCIAAIALLSLLPSDSIHRTELGGHLEHVLAYLGTAIAVSLAYRLQKTFQIFLMLIIFAGCLEYLQRFSLGRSSSFSDFLFSATGVALGLAIILVGKRVITSHPAWHRLGPKAPSRADMGDDRRR
jgi:VanZ family protein